MCIFNMWIANEECKNAKKKNILDKPNSLWISYSNLK